MLTNTESHSLMCDSSGCRFASVVQTRMPLMTKFEISQPISFAPTVVPVKPNRSFKDIVSYKLYEWFNGPTNHMHTKICMPIYHDICYSFTQCGFKMHTLKLVLSYVEPKLRLKAVQALSRTANPLLLQRDTQLAVQIWMMVSNSVQNWTTHII